MHNPIVICALYKFVTLADYQERRQGLLDFLEDHDIKGTLLLAQEGINGTVSGSRSAIDALLQMLNTDPVLGPVSYKESYHAQQPFYRTKVKLKKEIVTMGVEGIDPRYSAGTYLNADEWNEVITDPETLVIDTRNDYEIEIGTFKNAINPKTDIFRDFPQWVAENLDPKQHKKVAMFCTGGIRCEKSTAYLKEQGFDNVYHLNGGILQYLEDMDKERSLWQGECFVFDNRVAVNHDLEKGQYDQCYACRLPITEADKASVLFEHGVSCPKCHGQHSAEQIARFREREKQIFLAKQRHEEHVGSAARKTMERRKIAKAEAQRQRELAKQQKSD